MTTKYVTSRTLGKTWRVDIVDDENGNWNTVASGLSRAEAERTAKEYNDEV